MDEVANVIVKARRIVCHYVCAEPREHQYGNRCERESNKHRRPSRDDRKSICKVLSGPFPAHRDSPAARLPVHVFTHTLQRFMHGEHWQVIHQISRLFIKLTCCWSTDWWS